MLRNRNVSISEIQNRKNKLVSCAECTQKISNYRREWLNTFIDDVFFHGPLEGPMGGGALSLSLKMSLTQWKVPSLIDP